MKRILVITMLAIAMFSPALGQTKSSKPNQSNKIEWSPDSRHLLFLANWGSKKGDWHIWRAPLEGGKPIQLTHGTGGGPEEPA